VKLRKLLQAIINWLIPEEKEDKYRWAKAEPCGTRDKKHFLRLENFGLDRKN